MRVRDRVRAEEREVRTFITRQENIDPKKRQDKTRQEHATTRGDNPNIRHDTTISRQENRKTRQDKTRQGKARQGKTR